MLGGIPNQLILALAFLGALNGASLVHAQEDGETGSYPQNAKQSEGRKGRGDQPRGGIVQQFKSFTSNMFGGNNKSAEKSPQPVPLEAQNRRILPPVINRNRSNGQPGKPSRNQVPVPPPQNDPPSLPPITSAQKLRQVPTNEKPTFSSDPAVNPKEDNDEPVGQAPTSSVSKSQSSRRVNKPTYVTSPAPSPDAVQLESSAVEPEAGESAANPGATGQFPTVPRKPAPGAAKSPATPQGESEAFSLQPNASSASNQPGSTPTNNSSAATMIQMGLPHVELALNGSTALRVNEFCAYELQATNRDQIQLNGLIVRVGLPASVKIQPSQEAAQEIGLEKEEDGSLSLIWQIDQLAPTQTKKLSFELKATQPEHFALDIEWTALPQAAQATIQVSQPVLQLALEGPAEVRYGSPELYRLRVKNPGNAAVKDVDVTLTADPYGGNSSNIGDIPAGGERLIEVELTFQQAGQIAIIAHAKSAASGLESSSQIDIQVQRAELVAEWQKPDRHFQGSIAEYRLRVLNQGQIASENVAMKVLLPTTAEVISIPDGARIVGQEVQWNVLRLEAGAVHESIFEIRMDQAGSQPLQFRAEGTNGADSLVNVDAMIEAISDLKLSVIDPPAPAPIGKPVTYEIVVKNRGSKPATGVKILAQFSNGIEPIDCKGHAFQIVPGQVIFDAIPEIGPGEEKSVRVIANAADAGVHRFRTEVTCDDSDTQLLHEESTRYLATGRVEGQNTTLRR